MRKNIDQFNLYGPLLIVTIILLVACRRDEVRFIELSQYHGSNTHPSVEFNRNILTIYENYLVDHGPDRNDKKALKEVFMRFASKKIDSVKKTKTDIYRIAFYRKTTATAYFIDHKEDPGGFSSEELGNYCKTDGLGELTLSHCRNDKNRWAAQIAFRCNSDGYFEEDIEVLNDECN